MFQEPTPNGAPVPARSPFTRRRFLAGLGLLASASAFPLLDRAVRRAPRRVERGRPLLGTWVRIVVEDEDRARAERGIARAFAAIEQVDAELSIHRDDTAIARVNRAAGERAERVPGAAIEVVAAALADARASGGVYDPTILPLMRLYGFYGAGRRELPAAREVDETLARMGHEQVVVDRAAGTIGLARRGMGLDLGSLGKGWAVDRAAGALRAEGVRAALVDAGGKVYGLGAPESSPAGWSVGLFDPATGACERVFTLRDAAIGTSGNSERWRDVGGRRLGHLFDARTGRPSDGHRSASVLARTAFAADRLCTVAYLLGPSRFPAGGEALDTVFLG